MLALSCTSPSETFTPWGHVDLSAEIPPPPQLDVIGVRMSVTACTPPTAEIRWRFAAGTAAVNVRYFALTLTIRAPAASSAFRVAADVPSVRICTRGFPLTRSRLPGPRAGRLSAAACSARGALRRSELARAASRKVSFADPGLAGAGALAAEDESSASASPPKTTMLQRFAEICRSLISFPSSKSSESPHPSIEEGELQGAIWR